MSYVVRTATICLEMKNKIYFFNIEQHCKITQEHKRANEKDDICLFLFLHINSMGECLTRLNPQHSYVRLLIICNNNNHNNNNNNNNHNNNNNNNNNNIIWESREEESPSVLYFIIFLIILSYRELSPF